MARKTSPNDILLYRGVKVRRAYSRLLTMAHDDGVHFTLNSGYRSYSEQWKLWWLHKRYPSKYPVAAFPGSSTHNKRGWKEGLDINAKDGGTHRFQNWAEQHGMVFWLTVPSEAWHVNARFDYDHRIYTMWHRRHP